MNTKEIEESVMQLCLEYKQGITYKIIQNVHPKLPLDEIVSVINKLLSKNKVDLLKKEDGNLLIKLKDQGSSHRLKGVDPEEQLVFKIIEESSTQGIWAKDIRVKSNLHMNTVSKIIKKLEGKKLVKAFSAVSAPKKKRYILYDLNPDRELTGGAWYDEQRFDSELVEVLNEQCFKFLEQKAARSKKISGGPVAVQSASYCSSQDVLDYLQEIGIINIKLSVEDIECVLNGLTYDGKVQMIFGGSEGTKLYRAVVPFAPTPNFMRIPCGLCPIINMCNDVGNITPKNCKYMFDWLDL
ncbi:DNA-directed RNA polymerase III subunit RPC6 [Armadillidium nasatum]|uniref:DNA-directed RNA polymerase III subunit RPC6 n=1 Tax=Armadillidium nasatum TaxID=96803 RepID=A0A5N5SLP9_9CRUS|nr:DNA-directed RNA polymerase III subunit RPC6 [Armadillidium nasatum]